MVLQGLLKPEKAGSIPVKRTKHSKGQRGKVGARGGWYMDL